MKINSDIDLCKTAGVSPPTSDALSRLPETLESTAIVPVETGIIPASPTASPTASPAAVDLPTEELVRIAVGTFQRLQDSMPYIIELRKRFKAAPRGNANIAGCDTWEKFCRTHLHRTASALRKALQAEQTPRIPKNEPAEPDKPATAETPTQELNETFFVIRRKSENDFYKYASASPPFTEFADATRYETTQAAEQNATFDGDIEWVKVQASYSLTVEPTETDPWDEVPDKAAA
jgi:hypothetical protein